MSFYYTVVYAKYWIKSEVYIDYIEVSRPHATEVIWLSSHILEDKYNTVIRDTLIAIQKAEESWEYREPNRYEILNDKDIKQYYDYFNQSTSDEVHYIEL